MSEQSETEQGTLSLFRQIDEVCLRFEDEWRAGRRPDLKPILANFPEAGRAELLAELLLLEWHC
jgi:hypothetical protein